jgi:DNA-binding NarL/FixJ family response regulator
MDSPLDPHAPLHKIVNPAEPSRLIHIAVLDDQTLLVESLRLAFNREPGLTMVGSAGTCAEAFELLALTRPDILLVDVLLPDGNVLDRLAAMRTASLKTQFIVLTALADEDTLLRAVEAGASGFVGKHQPLYELLAAIRQVAAGDVAMPADLLLMLLAKRLHPPEPPVVHEPLTPREREILSLAADGRSSARIAGELMLSVQTVRTHLRNAIGKLNSHSRLEAVAVALRTGVLAPPR